MIERAVHAIKESPIFCALTEEQLHDLVARGTIQSVPAFSNLIVEGEHGDSLIVLLSGEMEVVRDTGDGEAALAKYGPGNFVGEMALIDDVPRTATVRTTVPSAVLVITKAEFDRLLDESPDASRALLRTILRRLTNTEATLASEEKMAALGRLTAELAHKMNNPASALRRSAEQLQATLEEWVTATFTLGMNSTSSEWAIRAFKLRADASAGPDESAIPPTPIERADREAELTDWLESRGVPNSWDPAANLAAAGWTIERLDQFIMEFGADATVPLIRWLSSDAAIRLMLREMRISAENLTEIVSSIKRYPHADHAEKTPVSINSGIERTLDNLKHRTGSIEIVLDLDPELPEIEGYPDELSQVWTNLIDNAVDAMQGDGKLCISTYTSDGGVTAEFTDSGPGIPEQRLGRVFEPFYTTKAPGSGMGLGLNITRNIVVQRHSGRIDVESRPGETTFRVFLRSR